MGLKGPLLSAFEKPRIGSGFALILLDPLSPFPNSGCDEMDITLDEGLASLSGVTKMTLIVANGGHGATSLWYPCPIWLPYLGD